MIIIVLAHPFGWDRWRSLRVHQSLPVLCYIYLLYMFRCLVSSEIIYLSNDQTYVSPSLELSPVQCWREQHLIKPLPANLGSVYFFFFRCLGNVRIIDRSFILRYPKGMLPMLPFFHSCVHILMFEVRRHDQGSRNVLFILSNCLWALYFIVGHPLWSTHLYTVMRDFAIIIAIIIVAMTYCSWVVFYSMLDNAHLRLRTFVYLCIEWDHRTRPKQAMKMLMKLSWWNEMNTIKHTIYICIQTKYTVREERKECRS